MVAVWKLRKQTRRIRELSITHVENFATTAQAIVGLKFHDALASVTPFRITIRD